MVECKRDNGNSMFRWPVGCIQPEEYYVRPLGTMVDLGEHRPPSTSKEARFHLEQPSCGMHIFFLQKCKVITLRQPKLRKLTERKVGSKDELQQAMWPNRGRWCGRETWRPDTHIEKLIGFTASTTTEAPLSQRTSSNPYVARRPSASHSFPYQ
jgi:hypothetical protein